MLTSIEKQKKLLEALNLKVGDEIEMEYLKGTFWTFNICLSVIKDRFFLKPCDGHMVTLPITYLLSHKYRLTATDTLKYQDIVNMYPEYMLYTGSRMQGIEQICRDFTRMWNNTISVVDTDNGKGGIHIALADMTDGMRRRTNSLPKIDNVYYNTDKKTTIVNWSNGEITKVKCAPEDKFNLENGIMAAIAKYYCNNTSKELRITIARAVKKAKDTTKKEN